GWRRTCDAAASSAPRIRWPPRRSPDRTTRSPTRGWSSSTPAWTRSLPPRELSCVLGPRLLRREHRVSERVAGLGEEDLQSRHPFDRRAMLSVVAVQDTNRPVDMHDRERHYLGR